MSTTHNHQTTTAQNNYNKGGKKAYFYLTQWAIYARNYYIDDIPLDVTDIVYAFWQPTTDTNRHGMIQTLDNTADNVFTFPQKTDWKDGSVIASPSNYPNPAGTFSLLKQLYKNRRGNINIKLAIGGWTMSQNWSDVVQNSSYIITSIVNTLKTYTFFNGVSIDWEYLSDDNMNYGQPGNSVSSSDSVNCITFFIALRKALNRIDPTYTIALCCLAAPEKCKFDAYEICRIIDELHVMTYDLNDGAWGNGNQIGHHTNLYSSDLCCWSVDEAVQYFIKKKVPSSKIYIGIAGYSRGYNSVPSTITNPFTTPTPPGGYNGGNTLSASYDYATSEPKQDPSFYDSQFSSDDFFNSPVGKYYGAAETGLLPYNELLYLSSKYKIPIQLDPKTKGAYLSIPNGDSPPTYNLYTFDSPDSIKEKCKYVNTNNLGGVLMWDITGDIRGSGRANNCSYAPDISTYANVSMASDTNFSINRLSAPIDHRCKYTNPTFYPCNYVAPKPIVTWEGSGSRTCMRYSDSTLGQNGTSSFASDPRSLIYAIINNLNPSTTNTTTSTTTSSQYINQSEYHESMSVVVPDTPNYNYPISTTNNSNYTSINKYIDNRMKRVYGYDVDSMRNIGVVAKSLLSGANYHNINTKDPGNLFIPVNNSVITQDLNVTTGKTMIGGNLTVNGSVTFTNKDDPTVTTSILPRGMIIPFSGTTIPKSWALCDGTMGTQDLRGRFILGGTSGNSVPNLTKTNSIPDYGSTPFPKVGIIQDLSQGHFPNDGNQLYVGSTGGIANQVLTTNELPSHSHQYTNSIANNSHRHHEMTPDSDDGDIVIQMDNDFGLPNSNTSTTGETQGHNNMPPYYVVQYIMKL